MPQGWINGLSFNLSHKTTNLIFFMRIAEFERFRIKEAFAHAV